ncbi:hypothetical protein [Endozoicomonas atrinae]|uniref:hypothetical protein n=1 Tax=Endozoicomonas atrinae TaxID=1333660 RepID=UPI0008269A22|nr:hypothetical protein [Endozoicomonas atrinae]
MDIDPSSEEVAVEKNNKIKGTVQMASMQVRNTVKDRHRDPEDIELALKGIIRQIQADRGKYSEPS